MRVDFSAEDTIIKSKKYTQFHRLKTRFGSMLLANFVQIEFASFGA